MLIFPFTDIEGSPWLWSKHTEEISSRNTPSNAILRMQIEACSSTDFYAVLMDASKAVNIENVRQAPSVAPGLPFDRPK